ncbi:hypothetical protein Sant_P0048 (plasmid) [Sodalis praecaptivus]|uniref:Glyoxalase-like domain-containing protein n=1 Tax=Sodalis praecaptivus TaxID=1239307 RepID=W0I3Q0_9GAMM|nr:VOC family protein [Sodalis praecaptivus]AHF79095.1 hypothetical protein Sant_P0048 [Sodalis praecaptivus]
MATLTWDHVVHYVNNLDEAIAAFSANQLMAFAGGAHPGWGTHNALSYFGLTYIEFLSIRDRQEVDRAKHDALLARDIAALLPDQQILYRIALRSDNIDATYRSLQQHGLSLSPIQAGKRHDAQGNLIEWRMFTLDGEYQGVAYPIIIQWGEPDEQRLRTLRQRGIDRPHPAGRVSLFSVSLQVTRPQDVSRHWQKLFNFTADERDPTQLYIGQQKLIFTQGPQNRLTSVQLQADNASLKNKTVVVGESEYQFI